MCFLYQYFGQFQGKDFETFIQDDLCPHLSSGNVVVMDNLNSHKSKQVQQLITATGAKPLYLQKAHDKRKALRFSAEM